MRVDRSLRQEYGQWLAASFAWQLIFTGTYDLDRLRCSPRGPHPEKALKDFLRWVWLANAFLHGPRWNRRGIAGLQFCVALELQRRGVVHCHAVVGDPAIDLTPHAAASYRHELRQLWYHDHGLAQVEVPRSREAVTGYVCKYVVKDGEFELSRHLAALGCVSGSLLARSAEPRASAAA